MTHSQFGEDDIIDELLGHPPDGTIADIGAGDGVHLSNSALYRERGWYTLLVEPNPTHADALAGLAGERCLVYRSPATPENINNLVTERTIVLSIDVDGDDIFLLEALNWRPSVIVVEHNPTMPYHADVMPARTGLHIGASVGALARVASSKGYGLVAVTHCNAIFQHKKSSVPIPDYRPAYVVATEYFTGRPLVIGTAPWGVDFTDPYSPEDVVVR